jgi:hypothetical protein
VSLVETNPGQRAPSVPTNDVLPGMDAFVLNPVLKESMSDRQILNCDSFVA